MYLGKTSTTVRLLENRVNIFGKDNLFDSVIVFWGGCRTQESYLRLEQIFPHVKFIEGFEEQFVRDLTKTNSSKTLLIIDDLYQIAAKPLIADMFTKYRSQFGISLIFITQVLTNGDKNLKSLTTVMRNATALILLFVPRSQPTINHLARSHSLTTNPKDFWEIYRDAGERYGYVFADLTLFNPDVLRLRTGLCKGEDQIVYYEAK